MTLPEAYDSAWLYYLLASAGLILLLWWAFSGMAWRLGRVLLLSSAAAFLLTPYSVDADIDGSILAPAWLMTAMEGIFEGDFARAGTVLAVALVVALIVGLLIEVALRKFNVAQAQASNPKTVLEEGEAAARESSEKREPSFSRQEPELESA